MKKLMIIVAMLLFCSISSFADETETGTYIIRAHEQLKAQNYKSALRNFEAAMKSNPKSPEAYEGLGNCYIEMGDNAYASDPELVQKGVSHIKRAMELKPELEPATYYNLGRAYLALDQKEKAIEAYEKLRGTEQNLANRLSAKINQHQEPKDYFYLGSTGDESTGSGNHAAAACGPGEVFYSATNTCAPPNPSTANSAWAEGGSLPQTPSTNDWSRHMDTTNWSKRQRAYSQSDSDSFHKSSRDNMIGNDQQGAKFGDTVFRSGTGATNTRTGEFLAPAGRGYTGTRDGTFYTPAGPNGVINTRDGRFIPVQ